MEHVWQECSSDCKDPYCSICWAKSEHCTACVSGSVELTTECVGRRLTSFERDLVSRGELDYKDGEWVRVSHGVF